VIEREVMRARVRRAEYVLVFVASVVLGGVIARRGEERPGEERPGEVEVPASVRVPVAPEPARAIAPRRIGCTLPVSQIGLFEHEASAAGAPSRLLGVAASAIGCTIATWSAGRVDVSRDDGATFSELATFSTRATPTADPWAAAPPAVPSVAVAEEQTVYVLHGAQLLVDRADGARVERTLAAPYDRVYVSGRWVVVTSRAALALSDDAGATWSVQAAPPASTSAAVFVAGDRSVRFAAATGKDAPVIYSVGDGRGWRRVWTSPPHRAYVDEANPWNGDSYTSSIDAFAFGGDGRLYAQRYDASGSQVFTVEPSGAATAATQLVDTSALAGAAIAMTSTAVEGARDAHGMRLAIDRGRGPFRITEEKQLLVSLADNSRRWLSNVVVANHPTLDEPPR
jgi:hypothetical protein